MEYLLNVNWPLIFLGLVGLVLLFLMTIGLIKFIVGIIVPHEILRHTVFWRRPYKVGKAIKIKWGHPCSQIKVFWNFGVYHSTANNELFKSVDKIINSHDDVAELMRLTTIREFVQLRSKSNVEYHWKLFQIFVFRALHIYHDKAGLGGADISMSLAPSKNIYIYMGREGGEVSESCRLKVEDLRELLDTLIARGANYV